mmetsp:Transcript_99212/g.286243  ORF Transcript_99212/g.286243 Transcript_99212/m.286243 type:complete len:378 (-) Transcript_99212:1059-2192(-)
MKPRFSVEAGRAQKYVRADVRQRRKQNLHSGTRLHVPRVEHIKREAFGEGPRFRGLVVRLCLLGELPQGGLKLSEGLDRLLGHHRRPLSDTSEALRSLRLRFFLWRSRRIREQVRPVGPEQLRHGQRSEGHEQALRTGCLVCADELPGHPLPRAEGGVLRVRVDGAGLLVHRSHVEDEIADHVDDRVVRLLGACDYSRRITDELLHWLGEAVLEADLPHHRHQLLILDGVSVGGIVASHIILDELAHHGPILRALPIELCVDATLGLQVRGVALPIEQRAAVSSADLVPTHEQRWRGLKGHLKAPVCEGEDPRPQRARLDQVVGCVVVHSDGRVREGHQEAAHRVVGRELLADRGDDDVRRLEVCQVEVVHQGHQRR